ncbi:hypothetical protein [Catellatospora citrea]|uniref:HEAT repeat protein n=1 Tax=Catellatospora citrea TaxID=53366 RepID=A0A8J3K7W0_9ACTN|nr:hypothetical protein [Catellatospora citrea]RKE00457.1 hypothetical protein C8E86_8330 [Catellatospora citrea]GIF98117.1 hypothetical protein Cci01nite_32110 [Catellatospora citrea]
MIHLPADPSLLLVRLTSPGLDARVAAAEELADLLRVGALQQEQAEQIIGRLAEAAVARHPGADADAALHAVGEATVCYRPPLPLVQGLIALASPADPAVLDRVLDILACTRDPAAADLIRTYLADPRDDVRAAAQRALTELPGRIPGATPQRYVTPAYADQWARDLSADLAMFTSTSEDDRGHPCGERTIGAAATHAELVALTAGELCHVMPSDLLIWYRRVREVSLPDIGNGYFLHPPDLVVADARGAGVQWIDTDGRPERVVVFGSDGGGTLYALTPTGTAVYRLPPGQVLDGVYRDSAVSTVAPHLVGFLDLLRAATRDHVRTGVTPGL